MNQHIENLLSQILASINKMSNTLEQHTKILNEHTAILNEHTAVLNEHTAVLNEHTAILAKHATILDEYGERLQRLENIVTRIENEHGEKLQILFDYFTTDSTRFKDLKQELSKINSILDRHDNKIYYLEFHKDKLLSSN